MDGMTPDLARLEALARATQEPCRHAQCDMWGTCNHAPCPHCDAWHDLAKASLPALPWLITHAREAERLREEVIRRGKDCAVWITGDPDDAAFEASYEDPLPIAFQAIDEAHRLGLERNDEANALRTRLAEVERSMVDHFTRDHLAGDGPEIDRWKRRVAEVERERQAAESRALRENSRADAQTARGDAIQEHAASLVTRNETLTAALETYGRHRDDCDRVVMRCGPCECACTCGFDQARGGEV